MACRSEPASGSVMATAVTHSPEQHLGNQRFFCSSEPKFQMPIVPPPRPQKPADEEMAELELECSKCHRRFKVQANLPLGRAQPIKPGSFPFPADNKLKCPSCGAEHDLSDARRQLQAQTKKPVV